MNQSIEDDGKRSLGDPVVRERRRSMLSEAHIKPLTLFAADLRQEGFGEVPEFDPLDGGVNARVLFLFEKPGPMTAGEVGSGFISRNNDDPTAEATFDFMQVAGIPRSQTVSWNIIPWWNGTRTVTREEERGGLKRLNRLIELLPNMIVVVFVGRKASKAERYLSRSHPHLKFFSTYHPSPLVRARFPEKWKAIPLEWAKVKSFISEAT